MNKQTRNGAATNTIHSHYNTKQFCRIIYLFTVGLMSGLNTHTHALTHPPITMPTQPPPYTHKHTHTIHPTHTNMRAHERTHTQLYIINPATVGNDNTDHCGNKVETAFIIMLILQTKK